MAAAFQAGCGRLGRVRSASSGRRYARGGAACEGSGAAVVDADGSARAGAVIVCRLGRRFPAGGRERVPLRGTPRPEVPTLTPDVAPSLVCVVTVRTVWRCAGRRTPGLDTCVGCGLRQGGAAIAGNTGASAWTRTRHPPFGEAGALGLYRKRGKRARAQNRTGVAQGRPVYSRPGVHRPPLAWGDYRVSIPGPRGPQPLMLPLHHNHRSQPGS